MIKPRLAALEARVAAGEQLAAERKDDIKDRFTALKLAVDVALNAADRAVTKAEQATEKRFEGVNEFRAALSDQSRSLMPRNEYTVQHQNVVTAVATLERRFEELQAAVGLTTSRGVGRQEGLGLVGSYILGAALVLSAGSAVITLLLR